MNGDLTAHLVDEFPDEGEPDPALSFVDGFGGVSAIEKSGLP